MEMKVLLFVFLLVDLGFLALVDAFWRLQCFGIVAEAQIDPIVSPGKISSHVHTVKGANGMLLNSVTNYYRVYIPRCDPIPLSHQVCVLLDAASGRLSRFYLYIELPGVAQLRLHKL